MNTRTREAIVCGADSETIEGEPMTIQFHSDEQPGFTAIYFVTPDNVTRNFLAHLERECKAEYYRIYVHHLPFDLPEFFWPHKDKLITADGAFDFQAANWAISGVYGRPTFCRLVHKRRKTVVEIVDSALWFKTSLSNAADMFCADWPKLPRLQGLGAKRFTENDATFIDYAMRDAEVCAHLGRLIEDMHGHFEIAPTISLASMAAAVFRTHYITDPIQQPSPDVIRAAVCAYHGGKNNVRPGAAPAWHMGVEAWDLSSAYPFAMSELPGFTDYESFRRRVFPARTKRFPDVGLYCISGVADQCEWPALYDHGFKPLRGKFENIWVHGTELNSARATGEIKLQGDVHAVTYERHDDSAMRRFAEHFYRMKSEATDPVQRFMYKILLNSLSGKFIQTREVHAVSNTGQIVKSRVAGGLYHPFIAGAITAHTRAIMHKLEHDSQAIHTATDGIYCYRKPDDSFLPRKGLGSLGFEGSGDLALFRNKLYILYADARKTDKGWPSQAFDHKRVLKAAMHGFQGRVRDLEMLLATNRRKYTIEKPNTLKDSLKRGLVPNKFERQQRVLKVGPLAVHSSQQWS